MTTTLHRHVLALLPLLPTVIFLSSCSSGTPFVTRVLYQSPQFSAQGLSGKSILILPVLSKKGFDTTLCPTPGHQSEWLKTVRGDLTFVAKSDFENRFVQEHDGTLLGRFYASLYEGDMLKLQSSDSVWRAMEADYLMVTYLREAEKIRDLRNAVRKNISLEMEIWQIDRSEVIWRASVTGMSSDQRLSDAAFVGNALQELQRCTPALRPVINEVNW